MKLAWLLGEVRYLPSRVLGRMPASGTTSSFFDGLVDTGMLILRDDSPREVITGSAARSHRINQAPRRFPTREAFDAFVEADHQKLYMSIRVAPTGRAGESWLVLEHATLALGAESERQFARYWRVIKPLGAFVSRQLLRAIRRKAEEADPLLDRFIPVYDVVERHHVRINAPAEIAFAAACEADLMRSTIVRAIFKGRELLLGSEPDKAARPRGLLAFTRSIGWGVLAEVPGREVVVGAVTQPWKADVVFRAITPDGFATFEEPGYVKIVWTLRADPAGAHASIFRTETRAVATDADARSKFRRYWSVFSPGIVAIRRMMLGPVKAEAERRARATVSAY